MICWIDGDGSQIALEIILSVADTYQLFATAAKHIQLSIITTWTLWTSRNKLIHEGIYLPTQSILITILGYLQELDSLLFPREDIVTVGLSLWKNLVDPWARAQLVSGKKTYHVPYRQKLSHLCEPSDLPEILASIGLRLRVTRRLYCGFIVDRRLWAVSDCGLALPDMRAQL
ncbi:hypothetical protein Goklo_026778, partial [Gossypium klotzschianum]|nr:hypothetical protein [Gossypium klotzschianum]